MYGRAYLDWREWVAAGKPSKSVGWCVETNFKPIQERADLFYADYLKALDKWSDGLPQGSWVK